MSDHLEAAIHRYGQAKAPTETPELLKTKLKELQEELAKIPESKKGQYLKALQVCPDQCDEKFMLKHLRCEVFNVEVCMCVCMCVCVCVCMCEMKICD